MINANRQIRETWSSIKTVRSISCTLPTDLCATGEKRDVSRLDGESYPTRIHICVCVYVHTTHTNTLWVRWLPHESTHRACYPFFTGWTKVVFLKRERSARRPVNLSLALLLGPFRSSPEWRFTISTESWLISAAVAATEAAATMVLVLAVGWC